MSIKFLVGGGGYFGFGGGECRFYFYGRADFSESIAQRVFALLTPEIPHPETAQMLQNQCSRSRAVSR